MTIGQYIVGQYTKRVVCAFISEFFVLFCCILKKINKIDFVVDFVNISKKKFFSVTEQWVYVYRKLRLNEKKCQYQYFFLQNVDKTIFICVLLLYFNWIQFILFFFVRCSILHCFCISYPWIFQRNNRKYSFNACRFLIKCAMHSYQFIWIFIRDRHAFNETPHFILE